MRRRRPLWRGFWCLLLGGLAWWLVAWGLELRPRWVIKTGTVLMLPVAEWPELDVVVVTCRNTDINVTGHYSLQLISRTTGDVRHEVKLPRNVAVRFDDLSEPRWLHGVLWRMDLVLAPLGHATWQLVRCDNLDTQQQTVLSSWQHGWPWVISLHWPLGSDIITIERHLDWDWLQLADSTHPYFKFLKHEVFRLFHGWCPNVTESWRLPAKPGEPLKKLSQWNGFQRSHYSSSSFVQGRTLISRIVKRGEWQVDPLRSARALGKAILTPQEIRQCYWGEGNSIEIKDAETCKVVAELASPDIGYFRTANWAGPYLITESGEWRSDQPTSIQALESLRRKNEYDLWPARQSIYRWDGEKLQPATVKGVELKQPLRFCFLHGQLQGYHTIKESPRTVRYLHLMPQGNELHFLHQAEHLAAEDGVVCDREGTHYIVQRKHRLSYATELVHWSENRPWLKTLVEWIAPLLFSSDVVVLDSTGQRELTRLTNQRAVNCMHFGQEMESLYTISYRMVNEQMQDGTLSSYPLPLRLYSPWWARCSGLLVTLALWLLLTRRARRGVA